ncbi:MAG: glycosyltransferase family 39 protein [Terracidiphilus sp.]|jgi:hypothetical protein
MFKDRFSRLLPRPSIPLIAAVAVFALHLAGNPHYGFFSDELYFIICGRRLAWGYVDQPPVAPLLAAASQVFGHSLFLLRALPAFFAAADVYVTCLLAVELGAAAFGQFVTACAVFFSPVLMDFGMKVSPDMVGLWLWPLIVLFVLRLAKGADPRWWLAIGAVTGVCLQSKYSVVFFVASLLAGLLLTPWFPAGCLVAAIIALPNFLWQAFRGFPMLELLRNGQHGKNIILSPAGFMLQMLVIMGLVSVVWIIWLFGQRQLRFLAYAFVILIGAMILLHGKSYYPADAFPYLFAAGGVVFERWTGGSRAARLLVATAVVLLGLAMVPIVMPILPEAQAASYINGFFKALRLKRGAITTEHHALPTLTSDFDNMHGWPEMTSRVAQAYRSLPPAERAQAVIYAQNYGEAAAIDFFGTDYGLPPVISGHNQYFLWGTHGYSGDVLICVGADCPSVEKLYRSCVAYAPFSAPWVAPLEDGAPIMVCRGIKKPLSELWPQAKMYM